MGARSGTKQGADREQATRERLLEAGLRLFGLHGFEATSTRALAAEAGVNLGAILYHFGGKEGLYRAVLEQTIACKQAEVGPCLARVQAVSADPASGPAELSAALHELVATLVRIMLGEPGSQAFSRLMMQEQIAPTAAYPMIHAQFFERVHGAWAALISRLTGLAPGSPELVLRTLSIMGQFIIFRVGMTGTLAALGCRELSAGHMDCIIRFGVQQVEAILSACAPVCEEEAR